jgi:CO/xanthine dehydrogenase FAD-binding subunit
MMSCHVLDARSAADAVALLCLHGPHAQAVTNSGDLLGLLQQGISDPALCASAVLVNLATAPDLTGIARQPNYIAIGALSTFAQLRHERDLPAMLAEVCRRGRPSDLVPVLIALDAHAQIASWDGVRTQPLADLYRRATHLAQDELLISIIVPLRDRLQAFESSGPCAADEFSRICAAVAIETEQDRIAAARIVLGGAAPAPLMLERADELLVGRYTREIEPTRVARTLVQIESPMLRLATQAAALPTVEHALLRALRGSAQQACSKPANR